MSIKLSLILFFTYISFALNTKNNDVSKTNLLPKNLNNVNKNNIHKDFDLFDNNETSTNSKINVNDSKLNTDNFKKPIKHKINSKNSIVSLVNDESVDDQTDDNNNA